MGTESACAGPRSSSSQLPLSEEILRAFSSAERTQLVRKLFTPSAVKIPLLRAIPDFRDRERRNMKTISFSADSDSQPLTRRASLAATIIATSALVFVHPVFAQTNLTDTGHASPPSFDQPWDDGSVLAPAPEQPLDPELGSMYVPPPPVGLIEPSGHPPINPTSPELIPPDSFARPDGGFDRPIR